MNLTQKPQTLLIILLVSLALNCVALGAWLAPTFKGRGGPSASIERMMKMAEKTPPELRRALREQWRAHRDDIRAAHDTLQNNRQEIMELLDAPQLDEAALRAKLAVARQSMEKIVTSIHDGVVIAMRDLPPEKRRQFAQMLLKNHGFNASALREPIEPQNQTNQPPEQRPQ